MKNPQAGRMATAAVIVMSSLILSRATGFVREMMLSWKVGLSWVQDAYVASFTVPDLMYTLLIGGTISAALIPVLSGYLEKGEEKEGWRVTSTFINVIFLCMVLLCILGVVLAPQIVSVAAMGFDKKSPETRELAIRLTRIMFPSVSFIMLAGICNGVLYSYRRFAAAAYGPSVYNIGCALSIYLFADTKPDSMVKVAVGIACSAFIYFLFQLSFEFRDLKYYRFVIELGNKGFQKLMKQAVPSLLSSSIMQLNVIISVSFVSLSLIEGSVSAFKNANTIWQLPYGIFATGIGTAMLPTLSRKFVSNDEREYKSLLTRSLTSILFLSMPSAVGFIILREPIVRAIFVWGGRFSESNVPVVAGILAIFSVAMITQSTVVTVNRGFYARQDTKTPLLIGMGSIVINVGFGYLFYRFTQLGASGMALSYSLISTVNAVMVIVIMSKKVDGIYVRDLIKFIYKSLISSFVMGAVLWLVNLYPVHLGTKPLQLAYLMLEAAAGVVIYIATMLLLRADEALYFIRMVLERLKGPYVKICKLMH